MLDVYPPQSLPCLPASHQSLGFLYPSFQADWQPEPTASPRRRSGRGSTGQDSPLPRARKDPPGRVPALLGETCARGSPRQTAMTTAMTEANGKYPTPSHHPGQPNGTGLVMQDRRTLQAMNSASAYSASAFPATSFSDNSSTRPSQSRPDSPSFLQASSDPADSARSKGCTVAPYLQIPPSISKSKGSLAEFAAQITCLFWFESSTTLQNVEDSESTHIPTTRLVPEAFPQTGFLKWVTTILSTTQVTQNVILLALLFIYRLKKQNPKVRGKPGSEFRLLTIALMLGNKFLDDNTYTNKTWAEVSGISVQEIHVMEVEFLSHMKYNLYTSKEAWHSWHQQLGRFWQYFDSASRRLHEPKQHAIRPSSLHIPHALPSPPASNSASPPFALAGSPMAAQFPPASAMFPQHLAPMVPSPAASVPDTDARARKRSWDAVAGEYVGWEPQPKRPFGVSPFPSVSMSGITLPSLAVQNFALPASQSVSSGPSPAPSHHPVSTGRNTPTTFFPHVNWPAPGSTTTHTPNIPAPSTGPLESNSARQSPFSSPMGSYPSLVGLPPSQNQLSPSHFLQQRQSPYRPVRNIRTLLVPPPSASLLNPSQNISNDQMHWQPLSKTNNETRPGILPYLHREAWPSTFQADQWPNYV